jgi:ribosome-associated protein
MGRARRTSRRAGRSKDPAYLAREQWKGDTITRSRQVNGTGSLATSTQLVGLIEQSLDDDKAEDIVVIDLHGKTSMADFMVIASGRSQRQVAAMAEHLRVKLKEQGVRDVGLEGQRAGDWVLIDGGDVIVHLFRPDVRSFYNLEKMWGMTLPEQDRAAALM